MIQIALIGLGVWLLVATTLGLLLGKLMNAHGTPRPEANHKPLAVEPRRRAS